jgi:protein-L-isoaspartate O-methyltransferase
MVAGRQPGPHASDLSCGSPGCSITIRGRAVSAKVPNRVAWTVDLLDVQPDDVILEFGCGPGVAANLVAGRLVGGHGRLVAVDRSWVAVERTRARNAGPGRAIHGAPTRDHDGRAARRRRRG